ncbi:MAG TPA: Lpg1974 family pore-forming outer membrane protein [Rhabdochlamydiaceae bacterium]
MPKLVATLFTLGFICTLGPDALRAAESQTQSQPSSEVSNPSLQASETILGLVIESLASPQSEAPLEPFYGVSVDPALNLSEANSALIDSLKKHLGAPLTEDRLQELRVEVAQFYHDQKKDFSSIEVDPQNTMGGVVHIVVAESNLDDLMTIENRRPKQEMLAAAPAQYVLTGSSCQPAECEEECEDESIAEQIRNPHLNAKEKFALLARKTDELSDTIDELCGRDVHISPWVQDYLHSTTGGLFLTADFLYWQADEDDLQYAVYTQGLHLSGLATISSVTDRVRGLSFDWNPGFRVGIGGASCDCDHWGLLFNYTHIRNKAHGSTNIGTLDATLDNFLASSWDQILLGIYASAASARWSVNYNTEILDAYRDFFLGKHLIVRPRMGLLNANIDQKYHATYTLDPNDPIFSTVPEAKMEAKCNYWGLGVRGGVDLVWHFSDHWGIYGELSAGLVYGRFNIDRNGNSSYPITDTTGQVSDPYTFEFKEKMWRARATIQTALGLEWETIFNRNRNRIAISAGYEFNEWFRQNQFAQSIHVPGGDVSIVSYNFSNADLAFKGGTLRATFNF